MTTVSRLLFTKYWMLVHLLVSASILCFFPCNAMGFGLWATSSLLLVMFALPPIYKGESFWGARERVKRAFSRDLLFWTGLPALFFLLAQLFNNRGTELIGTYDPILRKTIWDYAPAKASWLPSSFDPFAEGASGGTFFVAFLIALCCAVVIRCALPRKQRLALLIGLAIISGAYGFLYACFGDCFLPTMVDIDRSLLFILMLCVSFGIVIEHFLENRPRVCIWGLAGIVLNGYALMAIGSPWMATIGAIFVVLYLFFVISMVMGNGRGRRFVWAVILILPVLLGCGLGLAITKKTGPWSVMTNEFVRAESSETYSEQWSFRTDLASDISRTHIFVGNGPEAFEKLAPLRIKGKKNWALWKSDSGLPSDFFKFLLEQGVVGMFLIFLPLLALFVTAIMRLLEYFQDHHSHYSLRYIFIAITSAVGLLTIFVFSTFATPLHSPALLCMLFMVFATLQGWLPRKK